MSTKIWGPPTWIFFHTLIEKIKDDNFSNVKNDIINFIRSITSNLPCPDCSRHGSIFFSKVNFNHIQTKEDLKQLLYVFHNIVNKRNKKQLFNIQNISSYRNFNLINSYNNFIQVYKTSGNMKLLADNLQRQLIIKQFKKWLVSNINNFNS